MNPKEKYLFLRKECTKGTEVQTKIFNENGISLDIENLSDYIKYLINLSVGNLFTQSKIFEILNSIPCTDETGKLLMILSNNILADSKHLTENFIRNNTEIVNYCIDSSLSNDTEVFEWSYYLLTKLHTNHLEFVYSVVNSQRFSVLIDFLNSKLEKSWENGETLVPSIVSIKDFHFLCSIYVGNDKNLTVLINYCSRQLSENSQISTILLETGALLKVYEKLQNCENEGIKGVLLHIIANTIRAENISLLIKYIAVVLKSAELDINEPTNREWVFVIIRNAIPLSEEFHEKLEKIYHQSLNKPAQN